MFLLLAALAAGQPDAKAFDTLVVAYNPGGPSPQLPATLTFTPDGTCVYEIVGYPARGTVPAWPAAKRSHTLPAARAARIAALLKATDGLAEPPAEESLQLHQAKYALTLRRAGKTATRSFEGEPRPYTELLKLVRGIASQEFLAYQLEDIPDQRAHARYLLDTYARAELGGPYAKPVDPFDFTRFGGWASRVLRAPAGRPDDDLACAARVAGLLRLAAERDALAALDRHDNSNVREAARAALARLPEPK